MSLALIAMCVWVIAATFVAFLPMRHQYIPGLTLLILAPCLIVWVGVEHGWIYAVLGTAGFVSMFRRPLVYLGRKALGRSL